MSSFETSFPADPPWGMTSYPKLIYLEGEDRPVWLQVDGSITSTPHQETAWIHAKGTVTPQTPLITPGNIAQCIMADIRNEVEAIKQHATTFYTEANDPVKFAYLKSLDTVFVLRKILLERDGQ